MKIKSCAMTMILCVAIISQAQAFSYPGFIPPARYYDADQGRFISADTIVQTPQDPQSLNRYAYVRNNPINQNDPDGHFFFAPILIAAAIGAGTSAAVYSTWMGRRLEEI